MAISLASLRRAADNEPPLMVVYSVEGFGKTTFAASAPNPVFIQTEDGLKGVLQDGQGNIVPKPATFGVLATYDEVMEALASLDSDQHDFQTIVLDSLTMLETLIFKKICAANNLKDINDMDFGRAYNFAAAHWHELIAAIRYLQQSRRFTVILLAHSTVARFTPPETEPYDRYGLQLHKVGAPIILKAVDNVLFGNYSVSVTKTDVGFNKKVARGVGGTERLLHTTRRPAFDAKNRYAMPDSLPLDWAAVASYIPFFNQPATAIAAE